jgi:hypothetical protein
MTLRISPEPVRVPGTAPCRVDGPDGCSRREEMSGEIRTRYRNEVLTDTVLESPVDRLELRFRRAILVASIAVLALLWLGAAYVF